MSAAGKHMAPGSGFTLIEVLVAVTILAMIFAIIFGAFFYIIRNADEQQERAQLYHRATFVLNNITQNVASAYIPFAGGYGLEETDLPVFLGTPAEEDTPIDSLSVFTTNPRFAAPTLAGEIAYVTYALAGENTEEATPAADANNPFVLTCTVTPLFTGQEEQAPQWTMNIHSLKFEYFDGAAWASEWNYEEQEMLPAAVKVDLEIADSNAKPHLFSTMACISVNATLQELESESTEAQQEETEEEPEQEQQDDTQNQQQEQAPEDNAAENTPNQEPETPGNSRR